MKKEEIKERKNNNSIIWIIIAISILFLSVIGYIVYDKIFSDNTPNTDDSQINSENAKKTYYIYGDSDGYYQIEDETKDYDLVLLEEYSCSSVECEYFLTDDNLIGFYDNGKVKYKYLNKKEDYKNGTKTDNYSFKIGEVNYYVEVYKLGDEYCYLTKENNKEIYLDHPKSDSASIVFDYNTLKAGVVLVNDFNDGYIVYDINNGEEVANLSDQDDIFIAYGPYDFQKNGDYFIITSKDEVWEYYYHIYSKDFKLLYDGWDCYVNNNTIYSINETSLIEMKNGKDKFSSTGINTAKYIADNYLIYLGENSNIKIFDLKNYKDIINSTIKVEIDDVVNFYIEDNKLFVAVLDESARNNSEFKQLVDEYMQSDEFAPSDIDEYTVGYNYEFSRDGKLLNKDIFVGYDGEEF